MADSGTGIVVIAGYPGVGKTPLARALARRTGWPLMKWANVFRRFAGLEGKPLDMDVVRAVSEAEQRDPLLLARFAAAERQETIRGPDPVIIDGLKSPAVLQCIERALGRTSVVVHATLPESARRQALQARGDFDDRHDSERARLLDSIGLHTLIGSANLRLDVTNLDVSSRWIKQTDRLGVPAYRRDIFVGSNLARVLEIVVQDLGAVAVADRLGLKRASVIVSSPCRTQVLILQSAKTGKWNVPGGGVEPGESSSAAARRELAEETGIAIAESYFGTPVASAHRAVVWGELKLPEASTEVFVVNAHTRGVVLSNEHVRCDWVAYDAASTLLCEPFRSICRRLAAEWPGL